MAIDKVTLYKTDTTYKNAINRLENTNISSENKNHIYQFLAHCKAKNITPIRQIFYIDKLKLAGSVVKKDFKEWDKNEIILFFGYIVDQKYSSNTIDSYKSSLICFFRWLHGCNKRDSTPKFLNVLERKKPRNTLKKEDLVTAEDTKRIISCCSNPRDICMISMAYEMGLRNGELRAITISDITKNTHGYKCTIGTQGAKTEYSVRTAFFIMSEQYITQWINIHPFRHNKEAPLFCNMSNMDVLTSQSVNRIIGRASKKAIGRRIHQYIFRHSYGTRLTLKKYPEATIKKLMGHSERSNVLSTYQHIAESDTEDVMLSESGITTNTKTNENRSLKETLKIQVCKCGNKANPTDLICSQCNTVLNPDGLIAQEIAKKDISIEDVQRIFREELNKLIAEGVIKKTGATG